MNAKVVQQDIVLRDPEVMHGEPVFRGTRVPVVTLVDFLEGGYDINEFRADFPGVTPDQVHAALQLLREALLAKGRFC
ncbi:MAG: DUF433 domain-containing protein [Chloroflexia bacterium]|nr:DUF433 domain-containing protein [Chloroflexia bacterium]